MAKPRASSLLLVVALAVATLAAVNFFLGRNDERVKRVFVEEQLRKVTAAKEALEQERNELAKAKEALETQLTDATTKAQALAEEIAKEKRAREGLTKELTQAKGSLETERKEKLTLTEDLAKAKQSYQALSNELTTLRQAKEALEKRVKEMLSAQATEAERIVVRPRPGGGEVRPIPAPPGGGMKPATGATLSSPNGKVLVVNREFNFVVVNLGSKDGIKNGTPLAILRGDKEIGKAQVERTYDNMAAATVLVEEQKGKIQEGDFVRITS